MPIRWTLRRPARELRSPRPPIPIDRIITDSAINVARVALVFCLGTVASGWVIDGYFQYRAEQQRIEIIAPLVVRGLYGEILSHDQRALDAVREDLTTRYH